MENVSDDETLPPVFTVLHGPEPRRRCNVTGSPESAPTADPVKVTGIDGEAEVRDAFRATVTACAGEGTARVSATAAAKPTEARRTGVGEFIRVLQVRQSPLEVRQPSGASTGSRAVCNRIDGDL